MDGACYKYTLTGFDNKLEKIKEKSPLALDIQVANYHLIDLTNNIFPEIR